MSRPIYETKKDRKRQQIIADYIMTHINGCVMINQPKLSPNDYVVYNIKSIEEIDTADPVAYVEIKTRFESYPSLLFSQRKWNTNLKIAESLNVPAYLIVAWPVKTEWEILITRIVPLNEVIYPIGTGGRTDRNDPHDIESCVYIPRSVFSLMGTLSPSEAKNLVTLK